MKKIFKFRNPFIMDADIRKDSEPSFSGRYIHDKGICAFKEGIMISDELLDHLAETYLIFGIEKLLNITFEEFLTQPGKYTDQAAAMIYGDGLNIINGMTTIVETGDDK